MRVYQSKYETDNDRKLAALQRKQLSRAEDQALRKEEAGSRYHIRYLMRPSGMPRTVGPYTGLQVEKAVVLLHHSPTVTPGTIEVIG